MTQSPTETIISTATGDRLAIRTVARIPLAGPAPDANTVSRPLGVANGRGRVYVTLMMWRTDPVTKQPSELSAPSAVAVIDDATQAVIGYVPVGAVPRYMAVDPITGRVFVTHNAQPKSNTVTVIDGAAEQPNVIKTLQEGRNVLGVAVNPLTRRVYIAHAVDARITVIDADSLAVLGQIFLENGIQLDRIAVDIAADKIYIPAINNQLAAPWLYVIDGATQTWAKVSLAAADPTLNQGAPRSVALNAITRQIYVTKFGNVNTVAVLDHSDPSAPPTLVKILGGVGGNVADIQVDASRNLVFVSNSTGPGLAKIGLGMSAIDGATASVFALPKETPEPPKAPVGAWGLGVVERSGRIYITNSEGHSISVVETARLPRSSGAALSLGEGRWSEPLRLADNLASAPALVSAQPGQADLFALANDGTLWHQREENGRWNNGDSLGGELAAGPAAVASAADTLDVFAAGRDGALWHRRQQAGQWAEWESLGGALAAEVSALAAATGELHVFALGTDGALWHRRQQAGQWGGWESLGGALVGAPSAVLSGAGQLHVFALGTDGALWHLHQQAGQPAAWESLGGTLTSPPAAIAVEPNQLHVFAIGEDGTVQHRAFDGAKWGGWESLGQMLPEDTAAAQADAGGPAVLSDGLKALAAAPVVVAGADKRLQVVAVGPGGGVQHTTLSAGTGAAWQKLGEAQSGGVKLGALKRAGGDSSVVMVDAKLAWIWEYVAKVTPHASVLRSKDLLSLEFDFVNMHFQSGNPPQLVRDNPFDAGYIVAYFAPQNIIEEAFYETDESLQKMSGELEKIFVDGAMPDEVRTQFARLGFQLSKEAKMQLKTGSSGAFGHDGSWKAWSVNDQGRTYNIGYSNGQLQVTPNFKFPQPQADQVDQVARARLANRSWLVFKLNPSIAAVPYTYEGLLDACRRSDLSVAPAVRAPELPAAYPGKPLSPFDNDPYYATAKLAEKLQISYALAQLLVNTLKKNEHAIVEPQPKPWEQKIKVQLDQSPPYYYPLSHPPYTAIELPYRLLLSPNQYQHWNHETRVVSQQSGGIEWAELWHTRLEPPEQMAPAQQKEHPLISSSAEKPQLGFGSSSPALAGVSVDDRPTVRAIWSPELLSTWSPADPANLDAHRNSNHYQDPLVPGPLDYQAREFRASLDAKDRAELVHLTSNFALPKGALDTVKVNRMMLSALGGWINARGAWHPKLADLNIEEWRHQATMGRDHYVRVVYGGYLLPFGHKASLVKVTERKFVRSIVKPNGPLIASLRQRMFIVVREPVRQFTEQINSAPEVSPAVAHLERQMPFQSAEITSLVTPNLNPPEQKQVASRGQEAFWPWVGNDAFAFHVVAHDRDGHGVAFKLPMLFVSNEALVSAAWGEIVNHYRIAVTSMQAYPDTRSRELRQADLDRQSVAIARSSAGKPGDAAFGAESMLFGIEKVKPISPDDPPFYPIMRQADVEVPALKRLANAGATVIQYSKAYKEVGFNSAGNKGEVLVELVTKNGDAETMHLDFAAPGAARMGFVTPSMKIAGLSRSYGPVNDLEKFAGGTFNPDAYFAGMLDSKLLGGITLHDILNLDQSITAHKPNPLLATPATLAEAGEHPSSDVPQAPQMTTINDGTATITTLHWQPAVKPHDPFVANYGGTTSFAISVELRTPLDGITPPSSKTICILENFAINILEIVTVPFKKLEFISHNGSKPDVNAVLGKLSFAGALGLVQALADHIPDDGFRDPPFLDVTADGVSAGYTLAVPSIAVGMFNLQNIAVLAGISLPFNGDPANLHFQFARRDQPFMLTVSGLTGGGFFGIELGLDGIHMLEASLEFGGAIALNLGVAHGGISLMGGVYFSIDQTKKLVLKAYVRMNGAMEVLGLIAISVEFYMDLGYDGGALTGSATLTVEIEIAFFSKSVRLHVEKRFAGSGTLSDQRALLSDGFDTVVSSGGFGSANPHGDLVSITPPTFVDLIKEEHWAAYCRAFGA